ncbi:MAG: RagB/SusD family nutrient uptake outer membrane protein, partial [Muribaculaceae bacterium]|nr:RagB/SusD family nutrient uptake outer membrane protein [Muribaculaceae bacterium]
RNRVGMPYREATLENILDERLLELVWEGWRRQDMVRFGLYHKSYDQRAQLADEKNGYTTVFPIPQKNIDLNPKLKQNVGYK